MKKTFTLLFFLTMLFSLSSLAQSREDQVYLNNGSIYRGKVTGTVKGQSVSIEIQGRNLIVLPDSAVKLILLDQPVAAADQVSVPSPLNFLALASFFGGSTNSGGFTFVSSWRFPCRISAGAGMGIEWFTHQQIPLFADLRYDILKGRVSPLVYAQAGYGIPLSQKVDGDYNNYYGGMLLGAGAGLRLNFARHNALTFTLGYRYQKTKTVGGYYPWMSSLQSETILYDTFNRLNFTFGYIFN
jgi:hypothetical protein